MRISWHTLLIGRVEPRCYQWVIIFSDGGGNTSATTSGTVRVESP
jgi:hypothetical protein